MRIQVINLATPKVLKSNAKHSSATQKSPLNNSKSISFGKKLMDIPRYDRELLKGLTTSEIIKNDTYRSALQAYIDKGHSFREAFAFDEKVELPNFMKEYSETQTNPKDKSSANESVAESEDGIPDFLNKPWDFKPHKPACEGINMGYHAPNICVTEENYDQDILDNDIVAGLLFNPFEDPSDFDDLDF